MCLFVGLSENGWRLTGGVMAKTTQQAHKLFERFKWAIVLLLVAFAVYANIHFSESYSVSVRIAGLIILGIVAALVAFSTAPGRLFWGFLKASRLEMRKVVWPTRQETTQTTMIVIGIVILAALIMLAIDSIFHTVINSIILK